MNRTEWTFSYLVALVAGGGYVLAIGRVYGGYAANAPPWVNAIGGLGIAFCAIVLYGVYARNIRSDIAEVHAHD